jgi:hypothetical protein
MNRKQTRMVVERVRLIHHALADVITTMDLSIEISHALSREEKAHYERYWKDAHVNAIQDLQESLSCFAHAQAAPYLKPIQVSRTRLSEQIE